ncbi:MAG: hypothetical protein MK132_11230, partial [Lentisphaerales bacterium]|nr:hypothetical protein [Lentisphaerales bacterium]
ASFVTDFKAVKKQFTNWVNHQQIKIPDHISSTTVGLQFNEKGAIEVLPVGKPSNQWNLSLWLKYSKPNFRQAVLSHESFKDHNTGGWNLYYFDNFVRLHTVQRSYHHDQGDIPNLRQNEWFHLSINVKSSGFGSIVEDMYMNGKLVQTHNRQMLFLNQQVPMLIGGLTQNAMSAFGTRDQQHNFYFMGEMANLVYMNRVLKPETIKQLFETSRDNFFD